MLLFYLFPNVLSLPDNKRGLVGKIQDEKIGIPSIGKTERRIFLFDSFTAVSRSRFYHGITNYIYDVNIKNRKRISKYRT